MENTVVLGPERYLGKSSVLLPNRDIASVDYLISWLNEAVVKYSGKQVGCILFLSRS